MANSKTTNSKKTTTSKTNNTTNDVKKENIELKNEIDLLKSQIALMMKNMNSENNSIQNYDEDITVISLCNWLLNLTTEPNGAGTIYQFNHFGEEQTIPRDDLKKIINVNKKFIREGMVYIADEDFVKKEKLTTAYNKIIDLDTMNEIVGADKNKFKKVFISLPETQKDIVISLVINKIIKNEDVDMNIVSVCEEASGRNLNEEIKQAKEVLKEVKHD